MPKKRFDVNAFRVLTLTTPNDRIQTILEAYKTELDKVPTGVFLFAEKTADLTGKRVWVNAVGKHVDLL